MPIYAYKCSSCGLSKDILRKISDAPLTTCPACNQETLSKLVTAAGFQLKGSGWYVTDFRGGDSKMSSQAPSDKASTNAETGTTASAAASPAPAPAPTPAPASATTAGATT